MNEYSSLKKVKVKVFLFFLRLGVSFLCESDDGNDGLSKSITIYLPTSYMKSCMLRDVSFFVAYIN